MLRKQQLLELPILIPNVRGLGARAEVLEIDNEKVLHIDVVDHGDVIIRYFADYGKSRWIVYGHKAKWNQMGFSSAIDYELSRGDYCYDCYGRAYSVTSTPAFDETAAVVEEYFNKVDVFYWMPSAERRLTAWEIECRSMKREQYIVNRHAKIAEIMDRVPQIPEDFEKWLREEVFGTDYLYTKKEQKKTRYLCTACGAEGARKMSVKMGQDTTCPKCKKPVKVRNLNRQYKPQREHIVLMQNMKLPRRKTDLLCGLLSDRDGYVVRQMTVECRPGKGGKELEIFEDVRAVVSAGENWGKCYYGEYTKGTPESQSFYDRNPSNRRWRSSYLYPGNLSEVLPTAGMEHSGLDIIANNNVKLNVDFFVVNYPKRTWIEYLIKAGLYRLVKDITDGSIWGGAYGIEYGTSLQECLGIDGAGVNRMKQTNGGLATLAWLKTEKETGKRISQESIEYFTAQEVSPDGKNIKYLMKLLGSPNKLANYLRKQQEKTGYAVSTIMSTWDDYMSMCRRLNKQMDNEMVYKPKDIQLAHDECLALLKREDAGRRAAEVREKFPEAELNLQIVAEKYNFADDEYQIIVPESIEDIIVEGSTLGHCIDRTDVYFERIQNRTSYLVFLRKAERPEAPWYTLEIEPGGTIRQKRTVGNTQRDSDIKAFTPFLREWQKNVLRKMNREDRALAQASKEARLEEYGQLRARKEPIRNGLLRGQLLADVLEADLMEAM
jgi:hypothetical protein